MAKVWFWLIMVLLVSQVELKNKHARRVKHYFKHSKHGKHLPQIQQRKKVILDDDLIVQLENPKGKIRGHVLNSIKGKNFYAYQEIPYAAPPIGQYRLQEPRPHDGWEGVIDTKKNTKVCIQQSLGSTLRQENTTESEDCLYLNVYTPVKPGEKDLLPVFLWIHGGGFTIGDCSFNSCNPSYFMDYNVTIVTINYRIGALGFLTTDDRNLPGNIGLKDQQMAIKWVVNNIHLFGGNPKKITLGGQSAGGSSVSYQLISKLNRGLFTGIIEQSGTALGMTTWQPEFRKLAFAIGQILDKNFNSNHSKDLREVLLKASVNDIRTAQGLVQTSLTYGIMTDIPYAPIIENDTLLNAFINKPMLEDFIKGTFNQVPYIIGFTSEESLAFKSQAEGDLADRARQYDEDPALLINAKINAQNRLQGGLELKKLYTNSSFVSDMGAFYRFTSDATIVRPSLKQAEESAKFAPVYVYQFAYSPNRSCIPGTEHVEHATDLKYFWGWNEVNVTVNETIRTELLTLWTNFIKYQDPTPTVDALIPVKWPKLEPGNIVYLNINETLEVQTNPRHYHEIRNVLDKYIAPPFDIY